MKLNDVFPNWRRGQGIFSYLFNMPWDNTVDKFALDIDFHGNHSGSKEVSTLIDSLIVDNKLSENNIIYLARIIELRFRRNWTKLYETLSLEYNVLNPYTETISENRSYNDKDGGGVDEETSNKSEYVDTTEEKDDIYGFNSENPSPSNKNSGVNVGDSNNTGKRTTKVNTTKDHTENNVRSRTGNYSSYNATTPMSLINDEREIWLWQFFDQIYQDIDSVLTCPLY